MILYYNHDNNNINYYILFIIFIVGCLVPESKGSLSGRLLILHTSLIMIMQTKNNEGTCHKLNSTTRKKVKLINLQGYSND